MDHIHIKYTDFFQVFIFLLIILSCIMAAVCVNHIDRGDDIIPRVFFYSKNLFTKEKKLSFPYF